MSLQGCCACLCLFFRPFSHVCFVYGLVHEGGQLHQFFAAGYCVQAAQDMQQSQAEGAGGSCSACILVPGRRVVPGYISITFLAGILAMAGHA